MTPLYVSIAASIASILLILVVLELIRSRRLRERYALLWLATGVVLLVLSAWRGGLNTIAGWVGVTGYPPAVLFAVATLFILAVLLHYSTVISKLADQNVILAQRLALLEDGSRSEKEQRSEPDGRAARAAPPASARAAAATARRGARYRGHEDGAGRGRARKSPRRSRPRSRGLPPARATSRRPARQRHAPRRAASEPRRGPPAIGSPAGLKQAPARRSVAAVRPGMFALKACRPTGPGRGRRESQRRRARRGSAARR